MCKFLENVDSSQGEEEQFHQMEEVQLEEAGLQVPGELDEWEVTARDFIDMALKQKSKREPDGVNGSIPRSRERKKGPRFLEGTCR